MPPTKHNKENIKANLKKSTFWDNLINIFKLKNPTTKLKIKDNPISKVKIDFSKRRKMLEAKIIGADIIYDILKTSEGFFSFNDKPKIVEPDLDKPGITANPCKTPVIMASWLKLILRLIFFLWKYAVIIKPNPVINKRVLHKEVLYYTAKCHSGIYQANSTPERQKTAMQSWYNVKNEFRDQQNHPYFIEADNEIRRINKAKPE